MSDSLWPYGLQQAKLPCPPQSPGVCSSSSPLSWGCYVTIPSSGTLFTFCLQSFPVSGSFPMSQFFASGGQSIEASNSQGWFPLGLTSLISLQSKGLSGVFSSTTVWMHQFFGAQFSVWSNFHIHTLTAEKAIPLTGHPLSVKSCLCFLICCLGLS